MAQVLSQWTQSIDPVGHSPGEFLEIIHQEFKTVMSALHTEYVEHGYGKKLGKRLYLRIHYKRFFVDVGAMPTVNGLLSVNLRFCKDDTIEKYSKFIDNTIDKLHKWTRKKHKQGADLGAWIGKKLNSIGNPNEDDPHHQDDQRMFFEDVKTLVLEVITNLSGQTGQRRYT